MQVGHNSVEMAMEWLFSHPEDPSASAAPAAAAAENVTGVAQQLKLTPAQVPYAPAAKFMTPSSPKGTKVQPWPRKALQHPHERRP